MRARIFYSEILIDSIASKKAKICETELDTWLKENPDIKIRHVLQTNHTYEKETPMFCGKIGMLTTVLYDD
jgi:hypothetical protein